MPNTIGKFCTIQPSKIFNLVELDLSKNKLGEKTMSTISNCLIISSTTSSSITNDSFFKPIATIENLHFQSFQLKFSTVYNNENKTCFYW